MLKAIGYLIIFLFLGGLLVGGWVVWSLVSPPRFSFEKVSFKIESGEGVKAVSLRLARGGLIRSDFWFRTYVWARDWEKKFQAGQYSISRADNSVRLARLFISGPGLPAEKELTIVEGWNNKEIGNLLEKNGFGTQKEFLRLVAKTSWQTKYEFFEDKPVEIDLEGYLFPDTYRIFSQAPLESVVTKMLENLDKKLTPGLRAEIKKQGKNIHEVLTLASIIEKEVTSDTDRGKVADIFYKRLSRGIALQADSTVNYITGKGVTRSSSEDIKINSPYNTYKYKGLPPGPICNPGLSAIRAAVYPEANTYYYFLTDKQGKVYYAKTFDEHIKNREHL